ncbi:DUF817 family protein [Kitasatospora herbaricolor]|uniref:DUF817 family protein n=1 Tax=Kitasatospora herbaricolor TaxID=68217 RepID=UPI0039A3FFF0
MAALIYVNFFSHHWLPDARWALAGLLALATAGTCVGYTVQAIRRRMPLLVSFALIGFFLWVAENMATYFGGWRYPYQLHGWRPVGLDKLGAWYLLISVTFVLAAIGRTRPTDPAPKS